MCNPISSPVPGKPSILYTPAECPICKRSFFNKYSAKRHMIHAHRENLIPTRPYATYGASSVGDSYNYDENDSLTATLQQFQSSVEQMDSFDSESGNAEVVSALCFGSSLLPLASSQIRQEAMKKNLSIFNNEDRSNKNS